MGTYVARPHSTGAESMTKEAFAASLHLPRVGGRAWGAASPTYTHTERLQHWANHNSYSGLSTVVHGCS